MSIESADRAPRHRFVMRKQAPIPVEPFKLPPPIKCVDCGAVDIWCRACDTGHPIRSIEQHVHAAQCHDDPSGPKLLRQACPLAGKAETDAAHDQLAYERKREITAATLGLFLGFILGVVMTLATVVLLSSHYRARPVQEQPIER